MFRFSPFTFYVQDLWLLPFKRSAPGKAEHVLTRIKKKFNRLSESPECGVYPKELLALGIRDYREIFFKPYRLIYRVMGNTVYVLLIVDGHSDMQKLLQRRLLEK